MSELQELIHSNAKRCYDAGAKAERERIFSAADFVSFEDKHGNRVLSIEDLEEELKYRAEKEANK